MAGQQGSHLAWAGSERRIMLPLWHYVNLNLSLTNPSRMASRKTHQPRRCQFSSLTRPISCKLDATYAPVLSANGVLFTPSPALIRSTDAMKCLLDAMLVITKQDRLCHVIHATSDPFYQTWLRQLNVMQHCKVTSLLACVDNFI